MAEDLEDWFDLVPTFVAAYAPEETEETDEEAAPHMCDEGGEGTALTPADRTYLAAVELLLNSYPEMEVVE